MAREIGGGPQDRNVQRAAPDRAAVPMGRDPVEGPAAPDRFAEQEEFSRRALAGVDFPVYGVAAGPARGGEALAGFDSCGGRVCWVEVQCGDWASAAGPYVTVRSYRPGADGCESLPELEDVVEDERDRLYEQSGIDEGDGPGRVRALREWITVDGEPRSVELHEDRPVLWPGDPGEDGAGPVWAGRLRVGGQTVTVCGRGVAPGGVELGGIRDFERHLRGRTELLRDLASRRARHVPVEERELPPVIGLEAHRALVAQSVAETAAIEAQVRAGRTPRLPRHLRGEVGAVRWEAAVRQQMRLATESREEAVAAVTAMVDHLNRLSQQTHWLIGTAAGAAAVEEVVRYTVFASEVASLPAQRAWEQLWRERPAGGGAREWEEQRLAEQLWLAAWEQWLAARAG
ncbi:hypothetical protein VM98_25375 [Streptomyces rubellomurinus subsp. indigoferus]|uniref:Uncharacterized protein n=2 Tax=Streptomyces TaxID=1883 RepID=A0A0F2T6P1_STRR3|nr:hypothetical protein VM98_25375 [Streptomyces rubellomurinus subsp. indigoferus]KJS58883.1 hypothetical protein VM95_30560 [Streptomyces rubellomurinus]